MVFNVHFIDSTEVTREEVVKFMIIRSFVVMAKDKLIFKQSSTTKENEQAILLSVAGHIAVARTRNDLWNIINEDILALFNGVYFTLSILNEDGETHSPFLYSDQKTLQLPKNTPVIPVSHPIKDGVFDVALSSATPVVFTWSILLSAVTFRRIYH